MLSTPTSKPGAELLSVNCNYNGECGTTQYILIMFTHQHLCEIKVSYVA